MLSPIPSKLELFIKLHVRCSIRNRHDAEDLMQDIRILCLGVFKEYKNLPEKEVLVIARTACRNRVRSFIRTKRPKVVLPTPKPFHINIDQMDAKSVLEKIKHRTSPRTSSIIYYMERGLENGDIQTLFSVSRMTVHRSLYEARSSVKNEEVESALHQARVQEGNRTLPYSPDRGGSEEGRDNQLGNVQLHNL